MKPDLNRFIKEFTKEHFNIKNYEYQINILNKILGRDRRVTIRATTRAGKSFALGQGAIMKAIFKDNHKIGLIAPTYPKTQILMNYVTEMLSQSRGLENIIDLDVMGLTKLEKLKKEVSKKKITFKTNSSIQILSADIQRKGMGAMGSGFDTTIVDESGEIPDTVYAKIYRMLLDNPNTQLIEIGNPWYLNHFYEHHYSPEWVKIHIHWKDCVREGRMTLEDIKDQRRNLTPLEFKVLIDAEFPEDIEYSIFSQTGHINKAIRPKKFKEFDKILIGVDPARGGKDYTVITVVGEKDSEFSYIEHKKLDTKDLMVTVGIVRELIDKYPIEKVITKIDIPGMGGGIYDRLKELNYNVQEYIPGNKATEKGYFNLKAQTVFGLAKIMYDGRFWNLPKNSEYIIELKKWTYEIRSDRQKKVIDPEDKSPDFADSLNIAVAEPEKRPGFGFI